MKKLISLALIVFSFTLANFSIPAKADALKSNLYEEYNNTTIGVSEEDLQEIKDTSNTKEIKQNKLLNVGLIDSEKKNDFPIILVHDSWDMEEMKG